jgi:molybdopterin/thiamine biosynthesis adenylyltransferase
MLQNKYNISDHKSNKFSKNYSPIFLKISNEDDLFHFDRLIQAHSEIIIIDEIVSQLQDLIKLRNPTVKLSEEETENLISIHIGSESIDTYGVWVYYVWSNKMVHILDEKEFIEVKTSRNKNKITKEEQDLLSRKKIGVIGLSVGQSVAATMAMERDFGEIRLADFDTLELTNCNRIRTPIHNLGMSKAIMTAREIAELDPYLKVICFLDGVTDENIEDFINKGGKLDLIIDECDSIDIKVLCRVKAKEFGIPVVMEMSDRGMIDIERYDLHPDYKIFHGKLEGLDLSNIKDLTNQKKLVYLMPMVDIENVSLRLKQSVAELGKTLTTWPQLASAVVLGGGACADVARRVLLNLVQKSGRFYVDIEQIVGD